jgi:hypothetical protein
LLAVTAGGASPALASHLHNGVSLALQIHH